MPSSEFIEIDIADNDVAILDASACVIASNAPNGEPAAKREGPQRQQQQQKSMAISPVPKQGSLNAVSQSQESNDQPNNHDDEAHQLMSPTPLSKTASKTGKTRKPAPSSATVTPRTNRKKAASSLTSAAVNESKTCSPSTPDKPLSHAENAPASKGVAVATPGEDDDHADGNTGKAKRKSKAMPTSAKKSQNTLLSFFVKAGASSKGGKVNKTNNASENSAPLEKSKAHEQSKTDKASSSSLGEERREEVANDTVEVVKAADSGKTQQKKKATTKAQSTKVKKKAATSSMKKAVEESNNECANKSPIVQSSSKSQSKKANKAKGLPSSSTLMEKSTPEPTPIKPDHEIANESKRTETTQNADSTESNPLMTNFILDDASYDSLLFKKLEDSPADALSFASRNISAGPRRARGRRSQPKKTADSQVSITKTTNDEKEKERVDNTAKVVVDMDSENSNDTPMISNVAEKCVDANFNSKQSVMENDEIEDLNEVPTKMSETKEIKPSDNDNPIACNDDDATVDLEEIPLEMKAAINAKPSDNADLEDAMDIDAVDEVPREIIASDDVDFEDCAMDIDDDMTNDLNDAYDAKSAESADNANNAESKSSVGADKENNEVVIVEVAPVKGTVLVAASIESKQEIDKKTNSKVINVTAPQGPKARSKKTKEVKKKVTSTKSPKQKVASKSKISASKKVTPQKGLTSIVASLKKSAAQPKTITNTSESVHLPDQPTVASTNPKQQSTSRSPKPGKDKIVLGATVNSVTPGSDESQKNATDTVDVAKQCDAKNSQVFSEAVSSRLQRFSVLREKYVTRAIELASSPSSDNFEEECLCLQSVDLPTLEGGRVEVSEDEEFPDLLVPILLVIVQGSSLPLSTLAKNALNELSIFVTETRPLTLESISSKIKLLAQRKQYLSGHPPSSITKTSSKLDCFENVDASCMWRWELTSIDLLPQEEASKVKKARSVRRKLQGHHKSIINLISSIDKATTWLQNNPSTSTETMSSTPSIAKVSDTEEKVLKFEREEEKARLLREVKSKKDEEQAEKQKEKARTEEERLLEKKRKEEEKELKKLEAAKEREDAKRKRTEEKENEKMKKQKEIEVKEEKRKARMMSFFAKPKENKKKQEVVVIAAKDIPAATPVNASFDSDAFRKLIDSQDSHISNPFTTLSRRSRHSRQRKTEKVNVSVFVTVLSDNPFAPQPYDEERVISVHNKYKFLGFHEDIRPPYHGTWSKPASSVVTGRNPFGKDSQFLDYEVDSEAEWEEEDEDQGEDCDDDGVDDEDEVVQNEDEDNDGWLAEDDDLGIEDEDDATKELRKNKLHSEAKTSSAQSGHFKACVVAPRMGGLAHDSYHNMSSLVEGFNPQDAMCVLNSHVGSVLIPGLNICLDAFPPVESTDGVDQAKKDASGKSSNGQNDSKIASTQELSVESLKTIARFYHNSTLNSREKLVTELRKAHPSVTSSRAQAMRELDTIAEKRRLPNGGGVIWEVKADHLNNLGLKEHDMNPPPEVKIEIVLAPTASITEVSAKPASAEKTAVVSPKPPTSKNKPSGKKRQKPVSTASANLFASFLNKKQKTA